MSPPVSLVQSSSTLPASADVVIIGGGIAGVAAAYELACRGTAVVLLEKGVIAGEQSSRNWGWCRQQNRDLRELPLAQLALRIWGGLGAEIGEETGFRRTGLVYASTQAADVAKWDAWSLAAQEMGMTTRVLSGAEAAAMLPGSARLWLGGVHSPTDGRAEPSLAVPALARAAQERGAGLLQGCAARAVEMQAGRVSGVVTERGRIGCQACWWRAAPGPVPCCATTAFAFCKLR
jgi:glycine/D-amino acid oxidase-like deaminating enzyme